MVVFDWLMQHISNMAMTHQEIGCVRLADETHIQYGHGSL
jgi:hypothetical protein